MKHSNIENSHEHKTSSSNEHYAKPSAHIKSLISFEFMLLLLLSGAVRVFADTPTTDSAIPTSLVTSNRHDHDSNQIKLSPYLQELIDHQTYDEFTSTDRAYQNLNIINILRNDNTDELCRLLDANIISTSSWVDGHTLFHHALSFKTPSIESATVLLRYSSNPWSDRYLENNRSKHKEMVGFVDSIITAYNRNTNRDIDTLENLLQLRTLIIEKRARLASNPDELIAYENNLMLQPINENSISVSLQTGNFAAFEHSLETGTNVNVINSKGVTMVTEIIMLGLPGKFLNRLISTPGFDLSLLTRMDKLGMQPIHIAACWGSHWLIPILLKFFPTAINAKCGKGYLPIRYALEAKSITTLKVLIDAGANLEDGNTNLLATIYNGFYAGTELLIDHIAKVNRNIIDACIEILGNAVVSPKTFQSFEKIIKKIFSTQKISINTQDAMGDTALIYAVKKRSAYGIKILLNCGADYTIKNKYGMTALSLAKNNQDSESVKILTLHAESSREASRTSLAIGTIIFLDVAGYVIYKLKPLERYRKIKLQRELTRYAKTMTQSFNQSSIIKKEATINFIISDADQCLIIEFSNAFIKNIISKFYNDKKQYLVKSAGKRVNLPVSLLRVMHTSFPIQNEYSLSALISHIEEQITQYNSKFVKFEPFIYSNSGLPKTVSQFVENQRLDTSTALKKEKRPQKEKSRDVKAKIIKEKIAARNLGKDFKHQKNSTHRHTSHEADSRARSLITPLPTTETSPQERRLPDTEVSIPMTVKKLESKIATTTSSLSTPFKYTDAESKQSVAPTMPRFNWLENFEIHNDKYWNELAERIVSSFLSVDQYYSDCKKDEAERQIFTRTEHYACLNQLLQFCKFLNQYFKILRQNGISLGEDYSWIQDFREVTNLMVHPTIALLNDQIVHEIIFDIVGRLSKDIVQLRKHQSNTANLSDEEQQKNGSRFLNKKRRDKISATQTFRNNHAGGNTIDFGYYIQKFKTLVDRSKTQAQPSNWLSLFNHESIRPHDDRKSEIARIKDIIVRCFNEVRNLKATIQQPQAPTTKELHALTCVLIICGEYSSSKFIETTLMQSVRNDHNYKHLLTINNFQEQKKAEEKAKQKKRPKVIKDLLKDCVTIEKIDPLYNLLEQCRKFRNDIFYPKYWITESTTTLNDTEIINVITNQIIDFCCDSKKEDQNTRAAEYKMTG